MRDNDGNGGRGEGGVERGGGAEVRRGRGRKETGEEEQRSGGAE